MSQNFEDWPGISIKTKEGTYSIAKGFTSNIRLRAITVHSLGSSARRFLTSAVWQKDNNDIETNMNYWSSYTCNSIVKINISSAKWKYCFLAFIWMVNPFTPRSNLKFSFLSTILFKEYSIESANYLQIDIFLILITYLVDIVLIL